MKIYRYSRWDGTQQEFTLDADQILDAMSDMMMHGFSAQEAIELMQRYGFYLAGRDFRVMGLSELLFKLRMQAKELYDKHHMDDAFKSVQERFETILNQEQHTLKETHGYESHAMNDFLQRRHASTQNLSDAIDKFSDYPFQNKESAERYAQLLQELEQLRMLEQFLKEHLENFSGKTSADYETAQEIRRQIQAIEKMIESIQEGNFEQISPEQLEELLGEEASQSLMFIQDLEPAMRERGYLREEDGVLQLTPSAIRRIGDSALASIYPMLRKGRMGTHQTTAAGAALPRPDETKPYRFGDSLNLDVVKTLIGSVRREAARNPGQSLRVPIQLSIDDFENREMDFDTRTTTVLLLDLSWSMSRDGRFPAAKRVALAMDQLIRTKFPRDHFFIVGFATRARELLINELPEVTWDPGDPFTNLQEALIIAEKLIIQHPNPEPQILVITDGQPTAYFIEDELHVEWPMGSGSISPRAVVQTIKQVQKVTMRGITINTFMLDDAPELVGFVERMTEINHGRALFTSPDHLGSYLLVDHLSRRRRTRRRT